jgi:hypothetical protein
MATLLLFDLIVGFAIVVAFIATVAALVFMCIGWITHKPVKFWQGFKRGLIIAAVLVVLGQIRNAIIG